MKTNRSPHYRLMLIEPSAIVSRGIRALLSEHPEFENLTVYNDLAHGLEQLPRLQPDLLLINPSVIDFQKRLLVRTLSPTLNEITLVAVVYGLMEEEALKQYDGNIGLYDEPVQIVRKLRKALEVRHANPAQRDNYDLSNREKEILVAVARGLTNKEIADLHHISVYTVISHRKNISRKTGIKSVSGLTIYALLHGMIDQDEWMASDGWK